MKDKRYVTVVNELFRLFTFPQIAEGLYLKYKVLPIEYKEYLNADEEAGWPGIEWYTPVKHKITWFDEDLVDFPYVSDKKEPVKRDSQVDMVIDELLDNERTYYDRINFISTSFAGELEAIAQGKLGPEAREALGLTTHQIEYIFGSLLSKVVDTVSKLVRKLDVLVIVPTEPSKIEGGRAGYVADIFVELSDDIRGSYGPYNARYGEARKLIEHNKSFIQSKQKPHPPPNGMKYLNFTELWKETTTTKASLLGNKTIDAILNSPVKTFTNYQLYLKTLLKDCKNIKKVKVVQPETVAKLERAVTCIKVVLDDVDDYVKRQEEIEMKMSKAMRK